MTTRKTIKKTSKWTGAEAHPEPTPINAEAAANQEWIPTLADYSPTDSDGNPVRDKLKRILIMCNEDGTRMYPPQWMGVSILEAQAILAEALRVVANDITIRVIEREKQIDQEKRNAVMETLQKLGLLGGAAPKPELPVVAAVPDAPTEQSEQ